MEAAHNSGNSPPAGADAPGPPSPAPEASVTAPASRAPPAAAAAAEAVREDQVQNAVAFLTHPRVSESDDWHNTCHARCAGFALHISCMAPLQLF